MAWLQQLPPQARKIFNTHNFLKPFAVVPSKVLASSTRIYTETDSRARGELLYEDARALNKALRIRMARALEMLRHMPPSVSDHKAMQQLIEDHTQWFIAICNTQAVNDAASHEAFMAVLRGLQTPSGQQVLLHMAHIGRDFVSGGSECRGLQSDSALVQSGLHSLCRRRMMWQLMIANHMALASDASAGIFSAHVRPEDLVTACVPTVRGQCMQAFGLAPHFVVGGDANTSLTHVEATIGFMLSELLKNAARATASHHLELVERGERPSSAVVAPIEVLVTSLAAEEGSAMGPSAPTSVRVAIRDQGGGIPKGLEVTAWNFGFTTAQKVTGPATGNTIAGYGMGLPLARLFAEQFGGSLSIASVEGGSEAVFTHPISGAEVFYSSAANPLGPLV